MKRTEIFNAIGLWLLLVAVLFFAPLMFGQDSVQQNGGKGLRFNYPIVQTPICPYQTYIDVRACYGAYGDFQGWVGGMTAGSKTVTLSTGSFSSSDVGKTIEVSLVGPSGGTLASTISTYVSSSQVTIAAAASTTASGAYVNWGHDDTAAINKAIQAACSSTPVGAVFFPTGRYLVSGLAPITSTCSGIALFGTSEIYSSIVLKLTAAADAVTITGVGGPPTELRNLNITYAYGGGSQNCLTLNGVNGVRIDQVWLGGCQNNLYINGGSDVYLSNVTSELGFCNFNITNLFTFHFTGLESYNARAIGYQFQTGPTLKGGGGFVANAYDSGSANFGFAVEGYNDINFSNVGIISNTATPATGIYVYGSQRITFTGAHVEHAGSTGVYVGGGSSSVNFTGLVADLIGNYSPAPTSAVTGVQVDQGTTAVSFVGGTISNTFGTCMSFSGGGQVSDMSFINCAMDQSATLGQYGLYLGMSGSAIDAQFISGNHFVNNGYTYGTGVYVASGPAVTFVGNSVLGGYTTAYTKAAGTASGGYNSFTP